MPDEDDQYWWQDPDELREVNVIRLMADEDVDFPLWSGGLLFSDARAWDHRQTSTESTTVTVPAGPNGAQTADQMAESNR
ncbi:hypothetical protein [Nocardioides kongjuensis]|uniref:Uncharacterized protein n=2 Tax=Nocardioides kongjuensis TaxID=349522 RepID=A0A852RCI2_9ACTN|nr:hypothetical protein [Nocardioides kongjuensis]NYD32703.1 hypothetical protein [Nocardioides kongjuensis]